MSNKKSVWNQGVGLLLNTHDDFYTGRFLNLFSLLALNRFKWTNLPPGMESRFIERGLFEHGQVAFFEKEEGGIFCLPCNTSSGYNVYGEPVELTIHGIGYSTTKSISDVVRILNNDNAIPTSVNILYYAQLLAEVERTMLQNLKQQKFPYILVTTKDNELTMKNILKKIQNGEESITVDSKLSNGGDVGIHAIKTQSPYLLDKLQQYKNDLMNELFTYLGLNNSSANNSKKERLLVDEVNVNNNQILMYLDIEYKNRLLACEEINKKFNLNIKVEKTIELLSLDFLGSKKEGGENE